MADEFLAQVKDYMRIDGSAEDDEITGFVEAAKLYLSNAGISEPEDGKPRALYELAVKSLTLHYYDHRDSVDNEKELPGGLRPIITQLKLVASVQASASSG